MTPTRVPARILYPTDEVAQQLGVGLTTAKALIGSGQLRSIKIGHSRRVPAEALHEFVQRLDAEQNGDGAGIPVPTPPVEAHLTVQS
ncbi:helix-turn-helix domain-containing protein [Streptomyces sp. NPDC059957]|uniref:helix-turn-helix domain-containing protein n=1 Tax=unclassified Streptomyces TaxID=2593676 RepID=UPI003657447C